MEVKEELRVNLVSARTNVGLSQEEAAAEIGVNPATLVNWEKGKTFPNIKQAYALAKLYKRPIDYIIFFTA